MRKVILFVLSYAALLLFTLAPVGAKPLIIELPVAAGSYDIKKYNSLEKNVKEISYKVNVEYPAINFIDFYKKQFTDKGWELSKDNIPWECFIDGTLIKSPMVKQFSMSWENNALLAKVILSLKYIKTNGKWTDELDVASKLQPLFSTSEEKDFFEKLESSGNFISFMDLLNNYLDENNEVDSKLLLKENSINPFVVEYVRIFSSQKLILKKSKKLYQ
ncbi:MAG: hypothetical protein U9R57_03315 [Thermodesulfobacteriota bacterium]|nr:hypothetical protein [Thermodesulfobacteriota bacterium]